jgi:hypothetical protein
MQVCKDELETARVNEASRGLPAKLDGVHEAVQVVSVPEYSLNTAVIEL